MPKYRVLIAVVISLVMLLLPYGTAAADTKNRGLYISPPRDYITVEAGSSQVQAFTVANLTDTTMTVDLTVKQFSMSDYIYDYQFRQPDNDWLKLNLSRVELKPNESKKIPYQLTIPPKTAPGGRYYTLFASANLSKGSLSSTVQATTLLYLTVNGQLVRTSVLQKDSIPWLVTGSTIPYKFNVKNTGNIHYSAYFYAQLRGVFGQISETGTGHLLMPGAVRTVTESIPSPLLPGIYQVTYGYKVDFAQIITNKTAYIVFIPPWSIVAFILLIVAGRWMYRKKWPKGEPRPRLFRSRRGY